MVTNTTATTPPTKAQRSQEELFADLPPVTVMVTGELCTVLPFSVAFKKRITVPAVLPETTCTWLPVDDFNVANVLVRDQM